MINRKFKQLVLIFVIGCLSSCTSTVVNNTKSKSIHFINAESQLDKGNVHYNQFNYYLSINFYLDALNIYRSIDNSEGIIISCLNISKSFLAIGNLAIADKYLKKSKERFISSQDNLLRPLASHISIVESSILIKRREFNQAKSILKAISNTIHIGSDEIQLAFIKNNTIIALETKNNKANFWIQQYEAILNKSKTRNTSNKARLLRFKAANSNNNLLKLKHLHEALNLYREVAHKPGISATLYELAIINFQMKNIDVSTNQFERALFIRIDLKDILNTRNILNRLHKFFINENSSTKAKKALFWLDKLSNDNFNQWEHLATEFNNFL